MSQLLFELPLLSAGRAPAAASLFFRNASLDYAALADGIERCAQGLLRLGAERLARIAVFLPKQPEAVIAMFGAARAGCVFVPVNPLLKPVQVGHLLRDCAVRVLVTSPERAAGLAAVVAECPELRALVLVGDAPGAEAAPASHVTVGAWERLLARGGAAHPHRVIDTDVVSIFYTSGSTGRPKGVVLSHRNMVAGAHSV